MQNPVIRENLLGIFNNPPTQETFKSIQHINTINPVGVLREGIQGSSKRQGETKQSKKLQALTGLSEEERKQQSIDGIILDPNSAVGRARSCPLTFFVFFLLLCHSMLCRCRGIFVHEDIRKHTHAIE